MTDVPFCRYQRASMTNEAVSVAHNRKLARVHEGLCSRLDGKQPPLRPTASGATGEAVSPPNDRKRLIASLEV